MKRKLFLLASIFTFAFGTTSNARAQWVQCNGPYGGPIQVSGMAGFGTNLYVAAADNIYRSTDNGTSWQAADTELSGNIPPFTSLTAAGTYLFAQTGSGIYVSTDSGASWKHASTGIATLNVSTIVTNDSSFFGGSNVYGVLIGTNNGTIWTPFGLGLRDNAFDVTAMAVSDTTLFAGTAGGGIYISTNNGANWASVNSSLPDSVYVNALAANGSNLFAATFDSRADSNIVYRSTNNGASWDEANAGLTDTKITILTATGTNIFASSRVGVFISTDEGKSWTRSNNGLPDTNLSNLASVGADLFARADSSVLISTDNGSTWALENVPLTTAAVYSLAKSDTNLFAGTLNNGVYLSTNSGSSWTPINNGLISNYVIALATIGTNILAGTYGQGVFLSTNNGVNWKETALTDEGGGNVLSLAVSGPNAFAGTSGGAFRLAANDISWIPIDSGLPDPEIVSLAMIGTKLFAGRYGYGIFLSTNEGDSWTAVNNGLPNLNSEYIEAMAVIDTNLFLGNTYGIFLSTDYGSNWTSLNTALGIDSNNINSIFTFGDNIIAGTAYSGVLLSTNHGTSWTSIDSGLPQRPKVGTAIDFRPFMVCGRNLFTAVSNFGLWCRPLSEIIPPQSSVTQTSPPPPQIQSYPNPFTQSTTVTFSSQAAGYAEVSVVNLLGAQVAQLFSGELSSGEHTFSWDANGFAPGMYECVVRMNGQMQRVSMILSEP